jgi:hypothetical protein
MALSSTVLAVLWWFEDVPRPLVEPAERLISRRQSAISARRNSLKAVDRYVSYANRKVESTGVHRLLASRVVLLKGKSLVYTELYVRVLYIRPYAVRHMIIHY